MRLNHLKTRHHEGSRRHLSAAGTRARGPLAPQASTGNGPRIRVAADLASRMRAWRMAHAVYRETGLTPDDSNKWMISEMDMRPDTFVLLAEDEEGNGLGTVTLVFDAQGGLPCDEIFAEELAPLRASGRRLVEVTRLALTRRARGNRALLLRLINCIFVYARRVARATDFVIEVDPRHAAFYERFLLFQARGPDRPCPRVNGAPARLLLLDLQVQANACRKISESTRRGLPVLDRTLYTRFIPCDKEPLLARELARAHRPLSPAERLRFKRTVLNMHASRAGTVAAEPACLERQP